MDVFVAPATLSDASGILALQKLAYRSEAELYGDWSIPPLTQSLSEMEAEFGVKTVLKAVLGEGIVGSVRASLDSGTCRVGRLIVRPDLQGRGTGTMLMGEIEKAFPGAERFELFTGTKSLHNIRLYKRLGYRELREEDLSPLVRIVFLEKLR